MIDHRYWLFPNNVAVFVFTPWEELPFHSIKIIQIKNRNFKSLEGLVINTESAWNKIQEPDTSVFDENWGQPTFNAYCIGQVEEFKPPRESPPQLNSTSTTTSLTTTPVIIPTPNNNPRSAPKNWSQLVAQSTRPRPSQ